MPWSERKKLTIPDLAAKKAAGERLVMVAVGEAMSAAWAERAGVDIIGNWRQSRNDPARAREYVGYYRRSDDRSLPRRSQRGAQYVHPRVHALWIIRNARAGDFECHASYERGRGGIGQAAGRARNGAYHQGPWRMQAFR